MKQSKEKERGEAMRQPRMKPAVASSGRSVRSLRRPLRAVVPTEGARRKRKAAAVVPAKRRRKARRRSSKGTQAGLRLQPVPAAEPMFADAVKPLAATQPAPAPRPIGENGVEDPFEDAVYAAGEQWLEKAIPANALLPDIELRDVIAAGVEKLLPTAIPLLDTEAVYHELETAIRDSVPCSVIRIGDGELMALAQDVIYPTGTIMQEAPYLPYAGVTPPDLAARDLLARAVSSAHIVGVPLSRRKYFQPLLFPVLREHGIPVRQLRMTSSTINYSLFQAGLLQPLIRGKRLLLIGNTCPSLANVLNGAGYTVSGVIAPVRGFADIERVMAEAQAAQFDLALVAAGIPATVIAWRIAEELGKVALDFGHMADAIVKGQIQLSP
ncbi:succinyl-CoA synthetase [Paenibacillus sp. MMS18-CY102]|nr:succinyl-CoA synthetase [Paenibacillus sp. MMS18-CY102]